MSTFYVIIADLGQRIRIELTSDQGSRPIGCTRHVQKRHVVNTSRDKYIAC